MNKTFLTIALLVAIVIMIWYAIALDSALQYVIAVSSVEQPLVLPIPPVYPKAKPAADSYHGNVFQETTANTYFRRVLFTGAESQLVVMSIPPKGEVGEEIHKYVEQTLFFLSGTGEALVGGREFPVVAGDVVVVTPGTKHNFWNTGAKPLKIYTVYAPPNHIDGRIHRSKAEADADTADEAVGEKKTVR